MGAKETGLVETEANAKSWTAMKQNRSLNIKRNIYYPITRMLNVFLLQETDFEFFVALNHGGG